ncbi:uncharacterized protein [Diadema setosum]|uniref:uncharacterized protein n=1 Tax=Diadema setosum TaxID=31175 RepID=UPI003B3A21B4
MSDVSSMAKNRHFSDLEKQTLVQMVLEVIHIVEKKQNDSLTLEQKHDAWSDIAHRFNCDPCCNYPRSVRQVKKLWDNIKTRSKRMVADQRLQRALHADLPATSADQAGDLADLDAIGDDSIAEKVIYYMNKSALRGTHNAVVVDEDDEMEDDHFLDEDKEHIGLPALQTRDAVTTSSDVIAITNVIAAQSSRNDANALPESVRTDGESNSTSPSGHPLPGVSHATTEFIASPMQPPHLPTSGRDVPTTSQEGRPTQVQPSAVRSSRGASRRTFATSSTTPMEANGFFDVPSLTARDSRKRPRVSRGCPRTLERLQREECELRIKKLRMEMKNERVEHEERLRLLRIQQELLNSLRPNPASIISSLLR